MTQFLMLKAIALDDEAPALEVIEAFCSRTDLTDLRQTFIRTADAQTYLEEHAIDLLFLDINMPNQSGVDFYRMVTQSDATLNRMVIFTTAHSEYAVEGFNLNAIDYLLKPFTYERFLQAVQKAHDHWTRSFVQTSPSYLLFRVEYGLVKVLLTDILFIEGLDNYLKIHLVNQKPVVVRLTMKAVLEKLPSRGFARVHRSYIVSLDKIQSVRNKFINIGEEEIPLSNSYEAEFTALFHGA